MVRILRRSTTPSAAPKAFPRTTFAVFLPTPGSFTRASMVRGTFPPCDRTISRDAPRIDFAFDRKKPVDRISSSRRSCVAEAIVLASGNSRKRAGVTMFTRASVHWAERIVATRSSNGSP